MPDIKAQNETALASVKAIYDAADEANTLLDGMQTAATQAGTTLNGIYATAVQAEESAQDAQTSATQASEYASRALGNLASVQSVTETLNWITAHGTMTLTSDVALDPSHVYFVVDANGDYVVGGTHYSVVSEPSLDDISTYYELSINESLNNYVATHLVVDTEGLWIIPDAGGNKVLIATGSGSTYTTAGTYIVSGSTVLASFTADGIQVGQTGESHLEMDYRSMKLVDKEGANYFHVSDLRDKNNGYKATLTETFVGDGDTASFSTSLRVDEEVSATDSSHATNTYTRSGMTYTFATAPDSGATVTIVYKTTADGAKAYTLGRRSSSSAVGVMSVAEGLRVSASGAYSHAEGAQVVASGYASHAEGDYTIASGAYSHAEGEGSYEHTVASGRGSHAEGYETEASGMFSHAEGAHTVASGDCSHAQNNYTTAGHFGQTVIGKFNDNQSDTAFEIGNGTASARSNALAITWDGNAHMALDTTATSGTDKEIYDALVSLGWDSDVLV